MTDRFRRNGARAWLLRVLLAHAIVLVLLVAVGLAASRSADSLASPWAFIGGSALTLALNSGIGAAFVTGFILELIWLWRAAAEERAVNVFWAENGPALSAAGAESGADALRSLRLEKVRGSGLRDRVELLSELERTCGRPDATTLAESLLDSEESRVGVARHAAGTLVLLGLLGTFVGLIVTIAGVSDVVDGLRITPDGDVEAFLIQLKVGLRAPLDGMSIAFSTSLLGLAGSMVLGTGALGLSAAQASWIGKLEQVTALYLLPALGASRPAAGQSVLPATIVPARGGAAVSDVGLSRMESAARVLHDSQSGMASNMDRLEVASGRIASTLEDFRDRVAGMTAQTERVEVLLARLADAQSSGREGLNDIGAKLAELMGTSSAIRSDVRDFGQETAGRIRKAGEGLREALAGSLSELARAVRDNAPPPGASSDVGARIEELRSALVAASDQRREESARAARLLEKLVASVEMPEAAPPPHQPPARQDGPGGGQARARGGAHRPGADPRLGPDGDARLGPRMTPPSGFGNDDEGGGRS